MNIYVVVEGEKAISKLYRSWIQFVNPSLQPIDYLRDLNQNNFFIFAGYGQPGYWDRVSRAVEDVNALPNIDRLVISLDSEDMEQAKKLLEAKERVNTMGCSIEVKYVIQHFCIETWLLGNRNLFRKKPHLIELVGYLEKFDIRTKDPEFLPANKELELNRAQFAYRLLRAGIKDIHDVRKYYSKSNPGIALEESFFNQVRSRYINIGHIQSFHQFIEAFT
jgi:hypothetical protein